MAPTLSSYSSPQQLAHLFIHLDETNISFFQPTFYVSYQFNSILFLCPSFSILSKYDFPNPETSWNTAKLNHFLSTSATLIYTDPKLQSYTFHYCFSGWRMVSQLCNIAPQKSKLDSGHFSIRLQCLFGIKSFWRAAQSYYIKNYNVFER